MKEISLKIGLVCLRGGGGGGGGGQWVFFCET